MLFPYKNIVNACIATTTQLIINKISSRFFSFSFPPNSLFSNISAFFEEIHKSLPKSDINALIRMLKAKLSKNTL